VLLTPTIALRPATPDDAEAVATIWHAGWPDGHLGHVPAALVEHRQRADFDRRVPGRLPTTTVAVSGSQVVGFVTVVDDEIEQLYVAEPARGSDAAATLLQHGEELIARHAGTAWLAVVAGNARARRFYERQGWSNAGPFDNMADIDSGTIAVPCLRYEKSFEREGIA